LVEQLDAVAATVVTCAWGKGVVDVKELAEVDEAT
jgi:hypothetical protein